jgi:hypothetical protein
MINTTKIDEFFRVLGTEPPVPNCICKRPMLKTGSACKNEKLNRAQSFNTETFPALSYYIAFNQ